MTPEQAEKLASSMAAEFAHAISNVTAVWYTREDTKIVNGFFPTSLAMAVGFMLSHTNIEMGLSSSERKDLFDQFDKLWRRTAKGCREQLMQEKSKTS